MLESMSSRLLAEWMAYYQMEPFGDELIDTHLARIAALLFNANRPKKEKARETKDYELWKHPAKPFDAQGFFDNLKSWAILAGAKKDSE